MNKRVASFFSHAKIIWSVTTWILISIFFFWLAIVISKEFYLGLGTSETRRAIDQFKASAKTEVRASELLGDGWDRLCVVGDYADSRSLEEALGRKLSISEELLWFTDAFQDDGLVVAYEKNGRVSRIEMIRGEYQRGCHDYQTLQFKKTFRAGAVSTILDTSQLSHKQN